MIKDDKQQQAILSAGYADSNSLTLRNHAVVVNSTPHGAGKFVQSIVHNILPEK
jgi:hypothetical protein